MKLFVRVFLITLLAVSAFAASAGTGQASNAAITIQFDKHAIGPGHYVGTTADGGTIEMQVSNSSITGGVQHFTATLELALATGSFSATVDGQFNFSTGKVVLNGIVLSGWLKGAQVHEASQLVALDPLTFVGTVMLMPASAG